MALHEALAAAGPLGVLPVDASGAVSSAGSWARTMRVVAAGRRQAGWVLYGQLRMIADLVLAWQTCPPVRSCLPDEPEGPGRLDELARLGESPEPRQASGRRRRPGRRSAAGAAAHAGHDGEPVDERVQLAGRLRKRADGYERRRYDLFGYPGSWVQWAQELAEPLVASELAVTAGLPPTTARSMVDAAVAVFVDHRLPLLARLLQAGWVDWPKLEVFVRETATVDADVARAVEAVVLGAVPGEPDTLAGLDVVDVLADPAAPGSGVPVIARWTVPQLRDAIRAAILELDAAAAERRARQARARRYVRVSETLDGSAELIADMPAEDAAAVHAALTAAAKAAKAAGDPRTLDQLRVDELVARATRRVTAGELHDTGADSDSESVNDGEPIAEPGESPVDSVDDPTADSATTIDHPAGPGPNSSGGPHSERARCACGREAPVRWGPVFAGQPSVPAGRGMLVSLTMPLSTYLGLADQPARLDGHGPVVAGLARRIAADATRTHPEFTAWRCIVTDDVHGTVLGVSDPIWTPRHDPPPRLARLTTAMEPTCVFPGCRQPARARTTVSGRSISRCDLDHRIPYDPTDPTGVRGGGRTCSCNLQPLCRNHHQQKTLGALRVRAVDPASEPGVPHGTLEWTLPSGITCRTHPHVALPAPVQARTPGTAAAAAPTDAADDDSDDRYVTPDDLGGEDWATTAWQRSRERAARARADEPTGERTREQTGDPAGDRSRGRSRGRRGDGTKAAGPQSDESCPF